RRSRASTGSGSATRPWRPPRRQRFAAVSRLPSRAGRSPRRRHGAAPPVSDHDARSACDAVASCARVGMLLRVFDAASSDVLPDALPPGALRELLSVQDLSVLGRLEVGVATSAFQCEGGLDGPGEPATNWRLWAEKGRVERIGG